MFEFKSDNYICNNRNSMRILYEKLRINLLEYTINFFKTNNFIYVDPPILHEHIDNKNDTFDILIDNKLYTLNSSNAIYLAKYASMFNKVFSISPCFRKENKVSNSHLFEFRMLEVEGFYLNFDDIINILFNYIKSFIESLLDIKEFIFLLDRINNILINLRLNIITYNDFILYLNKKKYNINYGDDISNLEIDISFISKSPIFIVDYPTKLASWTALKKNKDTSFAFNLLLPEHYGELAEGCQRNNDYIFYQEKFTSANIKILNWFLEIIKENSNIRSGFGMGIERLLRWILNVKKISDTLIFPRFAFE